MSFSVGQRVVCVDDSNWLNPHLAYLHGGAYPQLNKIYTVRGISPGGRVLLEEIVGRPYAWLKGFYEGGWKPSRFRPLVERKTDISFAHEILRKVTRKDKVRA